MKISVVIITRNRREDIRVSLDAYRKQTYKNFEVILIDNQSTDGTKEMINSEYPEIKYLWLPDNFDIRSINIGIEMSSGEIIWRNDSDSNPETDDTFQKIIDVFISNPDIHIISCEDIEVRSNNAIWEWYPYKVDKENIPPNGYPANIFPGTGAAIRREVYDKIGGFWEFGFEELDFCTRALAAGFNIRYFPNIRVLHYGSLSDRNNDNRWIQISKQYLRYNVKYFPFLSAVNRAMQIYFFQMLTGIFQRVSFWALVEGHFTMQATFIHTFRTERQPLPKAQIREITLGASIFRTQMRFFFQKFAGKFKKWLKK